MNERILGLFDDDFGACDLMIITTGIVRDGSVQIEHELLKEGAKVTILAAEDDETFEVTPEEKQMLMAAIGQANRGEVTPVESVLKRLRGE